jgi:hypothetical protein
VLATIVRAGAAAACVVATACGSPSSPSSAGYAGQWSGRTAQGKTIAFTISPDERVTSITVGHEFNGCSGEQTFSGLSISIVPDVACFPAPCPAPVSGFRQLAFQAGDFIAGPSTSVNGIFAAGIAEGSLTFRNFGACGTATGVSWTASRR